MDLTIAMSSDDSADVGQQLAQFRAVFAVAGELELRSQQRRIGIDEGGAIAL